MTTAYSCMNLQERGQLIIGPGVEVYEGMIVGENARPGDIDVNPTKEKKLTNHRAASADELVRLVPPRPVSLEQALEFIADDECLEVTPQPPAAQGRPRRHDADERWRAPSADEMERPAVDLAGSEFL
jgi:GTP-binding protein